MKGSNKLLTQLNGKEWLASLSVDELNKVQELLEKKVMEKRDMRQRLTLRSSPEEIADAFDWDISHLQKEIASKR